jgi:hypothetical protein
VSPAELLGYCHFLTAILTAVVDICVQVTAWMCVFKFLSISRLTHTSLLTNGDECLCFLAICVSSLSGEIFIQFLCLFKKNSAISLLLVVVKVLYGRHQWLTPVILATQEAEIRRII